MELLGEFFEQDLDISPNGEKEVRYGVRKAVRAVIFNGDGEIAVLYMSQEGYHKLPGGGVEKGENLGQSLEREIREETGYGIETRPGSVGAIIEYRDTAALLQISYCYLADIVGEQTVTAFTEEEIKHGAELEWMRPEDALRAMEKDAPTDYACQFIRRRDLLFLQKAQEILNG